jgi:hypothetical protein
MKLTDINTLVKNQSVLAYRIIQSYINNPSIAEVTIYQESLIRTYSTEISKQVILDNTGGRKIIHDNFALEPLGWKLKGFLKPAGYEMTFYFQPSLKVQIKKLEAARDTRDVVTFKDKYGQTFQVGIEKMEIEENAECQNGIPISFDLVEVTKQNATTATLSASESSSMPKSDSENGTGDGLGTKDAAGKDKSWLKSVGSSLFGG